MQFLTQVNWIAVIVGGVFNMAFGALWYGPLFGQAWLRAIGKKQEEIQSSPTMYILPFLAGVASAYVLAVIIAAFGITAWWEGLVVGGIVWIGIGAAATITTGTFEEQPRAAWLLFALYQLVVYAALGVLFVLWT